MRTKLKHFSPIILLILVAGLLTSCSGGLSASSWPGLSQEKDAAYLSYGAHVYSIRTSDGSMTWRFPEKADSKISYYAHPVLVNDLLVVGDYAGSLHGLNPANGNETWKFSREKVRFIGGVRAVEDTILAPASDQNLYALDLKGALKWKFETKGGNWTQPESDGKNVFLASTDHFLYAIRLKDGSKVWTVDLGGAVINSLTAAKDGTIYAGTLANELLAVSGESGKILWRTKTAGGVWGASVLQDDKLYVGDQSGMVYAFSVKNGSKAWEFNAGGPVIGSGALAADGLIFSTESGEVLKLDFEGKKVWSHTAKGKLLTTPVVTGENTLVAITGGDQLLLALDKNGNSLWEFQPPK